MRWWFGGEFLLVRLQLVTTKLTIHSSITKLMGESFKLHSQALIGYEDAMMNEQANDAAAAAAAANILAPHAPEVAAY